MIIDIFIALLFGFIAGRMSRRRVANQREWEAPGELDLARASLEYARTADYWIDRERKIVGIEEQEVLDHIRQGIDQQHGQGSFPIHCQIPFSAFLRFNTKNRWSREVGSRRQDFTVVSYSGRPIMIIEYQGPGHYRRGRELTEVNDEIKRTVARRTGIKLIEIHAGEPRESYVSRIMQELAGFRSAGAYEYAKAIKADISVE